MLWKLPHGEAAARRFYRKYKAGAKRRGWDFTIPEEIFKRIAKSPCHYCGQPPSQPFGWKDEVNGVFWCNGVDRKDNSQGYVSGNCLPCCKTCNLMKRDENYQKFITRMQRIADRYDQSNGS